MREQDNIEEYIRRERSKEASAKIVVVAMLVIGITLLGILLAIHL